MPAARAQDREAERRRDHQAAHAPDAIARCRSRPGSEGTMKATKLIAVAVIAAAPLAIPTAVSADIPDTYTVTIDPTAALPGATITVTATDNAAEPGPDCGL